MPLRPRRLRGQRVPGENGMTTIAQQGHRYRWRGEDVIALETGEIVDVRALGMCSRGRRQGPLGRR